MSNKVNLQFGVITLMILLAAVSRLLPHPPNFTAVGAMGLFGAAFFDKKVFALIIPLLAMFLTDLFLNNVIYAAYMPEGQSVMWFTAGASWIYGAIIITTLAGFFILNKISTLNVVVGSFASAAIFFLLTNFGLWYGGSMLVDYPANAAGLIACFVAGIPFFVSSILGNLFYGGILFGSYYAIQKRFFLTPA